jgi:hypothetical protein
VKYRIGRRGTLYAAAGTGLALIAAVAVIVMTGTADGAGVQLSATPLGLNISPEDAIYASNASTNRDVDVMRSLLKAADIRQLRYGGSLLDLYDWQTNTGAWNCFPHVTTASFKARCADAAPLDFSQFSQTARAIGANSLVTVNYGSGTPAEAAAWVRHAAHTPGEAVALWEVGNETYGCWEVNNELAGAPAHYRGYLPAQYRTCPQTTQGEAVGMQTLATSYAVNSRPFLRAMKAADPSARIGVPWAFGQQVVGAGVPESSQWNKAVLRSDGKDISFVDAHYYPFTFSGSIGGANPTDEQVLQALRQIPALQSAIRSELNTYAPGAAVVIGETSVSNNVTVASCTPVGALFAAGDALSWLAAGAESVDWEAISNPNNTSSQCVTSDSAFTFSTTPATETPYYGYLLASMLARPHALLGTLATSDPSDVLSFQSALPDGRHAVALLNINTRSAQTVTFPVVDTLSGALDTWNYSAGKQNPANSTIVTGTTSASAIAGGITLPAESITVLQTR